MKTIACGLAALLIGTCAIGRAVQAETYQQRGPNGNLIGTLSQEGSRLVQRAPNGNALGYYQKSGSVIEHRTMDGRLIDTQQAPKGPAGH